MRAAKRLDWRRRAFEKTYPKYLESATVLSVPTLGPSVTLELRPPLTLLCGLNGSGKSRLLRALAHLLTPGSVPDLTIERQVGAATCSATIVADGASTTYERPAGAMTPLKTLWFDPILSTAEMLRRFRELNELVDVISGVESHVFDGDLLELTQGVVQRRYDLVESFDLTEEAIPFPYFRATWGTAQYGLEDMALGELSSIYLLHLLSRADAGTMVFLEEPESFLSPIGQVALMDAIHYYCAKRALTFLISTHSPTIASQVPAANLGCVDRVEARTVVVRTPARAESLSTISILSNVGGVVFVEDEVATAFMREVLRRGCACYHHVLEVAPCGDKEKVRNALRSLRPLNERLFTVGVLDGDARDEPNDTGALVLYLPGAVRPERLLRGAAVAAPEVLAGLLSVRQETLSAALAKSGGADDHDWVRALGDGVGVGPDRMLDLLIDVWFTVPENEAAASSLCDAIWKKVPGA